MARFGILRHTTATLSKGRKKKSLSEKEKGKLRLFNLRAEWIPNCSKNKWTIGKINEANGCQNSRPGVNGPLLQWWFKVVPIFLQYKMSFEISVTPEQLKKCVKNCKKLRNAWNMLTS